MLSQFLFKIARNPLAAPLIRWSFTHMTDFMPIDKLRDTDQVMAFYHPKPSYQTHILIVPKKAIANLTELVLEDYPYVEAVLQVAQELVSELGLAERGYRLIVNGGAYQDIPQLHFHLVSDGA